jgi:hypothetical protein
LRRAREARDVWEQRNVQGEKSERQAVCLGARAREPGAVITEIGRRKNERQVNPLDKRVFEMLGERYWEIA